MINKFIVMIGLFIVAQIINAATNWESMNVPPLVESSYNSQDQIIQNQARDTKMLEQKMHLNYDVGASAINESLKWQNGNSPRPILKADGVVRFPYGVYQPVVTCKPLNLCDIELQKKEEIQGILIGDSIRWNEADNGIPVVYSGEANSLVPHLVLKPSQAGLETTLMITTSKRTYMIKLRSANFGYVERAGFYYPSEEMVNYKLTPTQIKQKNLGNNLSSVIDNTINHPDKLNYNYKIENKSYDWKPTQVYDDGISVFIKFPNNISSKDLPSLCIISVTDNIQCELVNFRYLNNYYVIDKLFNKAKLVNGFGKNAETITITSTKINKISNGHFWSRLFGG